MLGQKLAPAEWEDNYSCGGWPLSGRAGWLSVSARLRTVRFGGTVEVVHFER